MEHKILHEMPVDLDKLKYDLSLIYAKEKLHQALCDGSIIEQDADSEAISQCNEIDFLTEAFPLLSSISQTILMITSSRSLMYSTEIKTNREGSNKLPSILLVLSVT